MVPLVGFFTLANKQVNEGLRQVFRRALNGILGHVTFRHYQGRRNLFAPTHFTDGVFSVLDRTRVRRAIYFIRSRHFGHTTVRILFFCMLRRASNHNSRSILVFTRRFHIIRVNCTTNSNNSVRVHVFHRFTNVVNRLRHRLTD